MSVFLKLQVFRDHKYISKQSQMHLKSLNTEKIIFFFLLTHSDNPNTIMQA